MQGEQVSGRPHAVPFYARHPWFWRVISYAFVGYLIVSAGQEARSDSPLLRRVVVVVLIGAYAVTYLNTLPHGTAGSEPIRRCLILVVLGVTVVVLLGPDDIGLLMFALVSACTTLSAQRAFTITTVLCVGMLVHTGLSEEGPQFGEVSIYGAISLMLIVMMGLRTTLGELRVANAEVARLAVADERGRVARDLHDVLGHSLTTITVKAGLARKLMEAGESERAGAEINDVERLTRQSLTDMRATVSGRRETSLPAELAGARAVLDAAGIEAVFPQSADDVAERYREGFAYVLREGVTNVVRHSGARRCEVRLGPSWLEVTDDGVGPGAEHGNGSGLDGLRERLAAVEATVRVGWASGGGFRLRAEAEQV